MIAFQSWLGEQLVTLNEAGVNTLCSDTEWSASQLDAAVANNSDWADISPAARAEVIEKQINGFCERN